MSNILVSIIIPVYNVESYLTKCLESIVKQKVLDYEVIIIDDESTDGTLQVAENAKDMFENIQILKQAHAGQAKARNLGLKNARGKYITFIDGDDYWEEGHLSRLYGVLVDTDCDMAIGTMYNIIESGEKSLVRVIDNATVIVGETDILFREKIIIGSMCMVTCRKEMVEQYGIRFTEEYSCNEDFDFMLSCSIHAEKVALLNWTYYNYFRDNVESTYVNLNGNKIIVFMQVCQKWYDYFSANIEKYSYSDNVLSGITRHSSWALNQMRELPRRDIDFGFLCRYFKETRYVFWPDDEDKNVYLYIWKMRIQKNCCNIKKKCKSIVKRIFGKGYAR